MTDVKNSYVSVLLFFIAGVVAYVFMIEAKYALFLSFLFFIGLIFVKRPVIAIMVGLFLALDLIPGREILPVRGGMKPVFMIILVLFVGIFILELHSSQKIYLPKTALNVLILLFLMLILFSVFIAHYKFSVSVKDALKASCYWYSLSFYFFITGVVKEKRQIEALVGYLIVLANIFSVLAVLQWLSGFSVPIFPGAFAIRQEGDVLRIVGVLTPVAIVWPIFLADIILNKVSRRKMLFYIFEFVVFGMAFMVQMTRAFWIAITISLGIVFVVGSVYCKERITLAAKIAVIIFLLTFGWLITGFFLGRQGEVFAPYKERLMSMSSYKKLVEASTFRGRQLENANAADIMKKYPLTGVGFGNMLISIKSESGTFFGMHNNYYFIGGTMGFPGLIVYLLIVATVLVRSWGNYRKIKDPHLICVFWGNCAFFLGRLVQGWSTGNISGSLLAYFALVIGINEAIIHLNDMQISPVNRPVGRVNSKILRGQNQNVRYLRNI